MIIIVFVLIEKSYFWAVIAAFLEQLKPISIFFILEVPIYSIFSGQMKFESLKIK